MSKNHKLKHQAANRFNAGTSIDPEYSQTQQENPREGDGGVDYKAIELKAYQIYQEKGGSDIDNWLEAERILKQERGG